MMPSPLFIHLRELKETGGSLFVELALQQENTNEGEDDNINDANETNKKSNK